MQFEAVTSRGTVKAQVIELTVEVRNTRTSKTIARSMGMKWEVVRVPGQEYVELYSTKDRV
jgi:alkyl hydroperoxide reductase subunit AhpF